ncbi:hypothetical protein PAUR_a1554 [Pseudoalteromonas aurantia 208]|uniref:Orphan protein n=1 Tax=Pseudoalteromonas aurantia 208 TaxID=1314867 RepID=A0ABR9EBB7_9GAMM|nr:hypothetical protein [Pseudoalteromonas aurantia 208]
MAAFGHKILRKLLLSCGCNIVTFFYEIRIEGMLDPRIDRAPHRSIPEVTQT